MGNFARRGRIWLRRRGMGRSLVARWPIVPASEVPDDLVDQAMAVLQGKSREAVIRELQRTVSFVFLLEAHYYNNMVWPHLGPHKSI